MKITKKTKLAVELHAYAPELNRLFIEGREVKGLVNKETGNFTEQYTLAPTLAYAKTKNSMYNVVKLLDNKFEFQF